jgi:hypothetical protein
VRQAVLCAMLLRISVGIEVLLSRGRGVHRIGTECVSNRDSLDLRVVRRMLTARYQLNCICIGSKRGRHSKINEGSGEAKCGCA